MHVIVMPIRLPDDLNAKAMNDVDYVASASCVGPRRRLLGCDARLDEGRGGYPVAQRIVRRVYLEIHGLAERVLGLGRSDLPVLLHEPFVVRPVGYDELLAGRTGHALGHPVGKSQHDWVERPIHSRSWGDYRASDRLLYSLRRAEVGISWGEVRKFHSGS